MFDAPPPAQDAEPAPDPPPPAGSDTVLVPFQSVDAKPEEPPVEEPPAAPAYADEPYVDPTAPAYGDVPDDPTAPDYGDYPDDPTAPTYGEPQEG